VRHWLETVAPITADTTIKLAIERNNDIRSLLTSREAKDVPGGWAHDPQRSRRVVLPHRTETLASICNIAYSCALQRSPAAESAAFRASPQARALKQLSQLVNWPPALPCDLQLSEE
jgi:hypothetical protein